MICSDFPNELPLFDLLSNADLFSQASLFIYTKLITLILTTTVYIYANVQNLFIPSNVLFGCVNVMICRIHPLK